MTTRKRRIYKNIDNLPREVKEKLDNMLSLRGENYMSLNNIAKEIDKLGYSIKTSALLERSREIED